MNSNIVFVYFQNMLRILYDIKEKQSSLKRSKSFEQTNKYIGLSQYVSEKAIAPHSSTLAWKIPWAEEPDGLQSMGSQRVGHD